VTRPLIAVFGSSTAAQDSDAYRLAEGLGRLLALAGADVMSGGYSGVMDAVSRGAREKGGRVIGVTTELFARRSPPSQWLTERIHTDDLFDRLRHLIMRPTGYVVAGGNLGTLTELFLAWTMLSVSGRAAAPLVLLGERYAGLLDHLATTGLVESANHLSLVRHATTAEDAVRLLGLGGDVVLSD
jgi:hypothetical protein